MMTVNITPRGRTVLRHSFDKPREEITVSKKLSARERKKAARKADRDARFAHAQTLKAEAAQIVGMHMRGVTKEDE
jgi:hypothetical protein